jgi:hypothetical protein
MASFPEPLTFQRSNFLISLHSRVLASYFFLLSFSFQNESENGEVVRAAPVWAEERRQSRERIGTICGFGKASWAYHGATPGWERKRQRWPRWAFVVDWAAAAWNLNREGTAADWVVRWRR